MLPVVLWLGERESPRPNAIAGLELARGRALDPLRSVGEDLAAMLSRCEKVLESEDGRREKRRDGLLVSLELFVFLRVNPKERRPESLDCLEVDMASFDIGAAMEVGASSPLGEAHMSFAKSSTPWDPASMTVDDQRTWTSYVPKSR
jgi:hypothetical protein